MSKLLETVRKHVIRGNSLTLSISLMVTESHCTKTIKLIMSFKKITNINPTPTIPGILSPIDR